MNATPYSPAHTRRQFITNLATASVGACLHGQEADKFEPAPRPIPGVTKFV